jgi:hypothetical protein
MVKPTSRVDGACNATLTRLFLGGRERGGTISMRWENYHTKHSFMQVGALARLGAVGQARRPGVAKRPAVPAELARTYSPIRFALRQNLFSPSASSNRRVSQRGGAFREMRARARDGRLRRGLPTGGA